MKNVPRLMTVRPEQVGDVYRRLGELLAIAARHFGWKVLPGIEVSFDLKGQAAGQMQLQGKQLRLRFNPILMNQNYQHFIEVAVGHELAHAVAALVYGRKIKPHGLEWQSIMVLFGLEAERCHDYDVSQAQVRRLQRFRYRCACREHELTVIRHRRIQSGEREYICRSCGQKLTLIEQDH